MTRSQRMMLLFSAFCVMMIALFECGRAHAHDWYEAACCSGKDCAPVADGVVTETAGGVVVKGFGVLNESDSRLRWSQDDRDHICAMPATNFAPVKLMCVYRKRKFM